MNSWEKLLERHDYVEGCALNLARNFLVGDDQEYLEN
jgi:hypothetical protein